MSDESQLEQVLDTRTRKTLSDVRIILGALAGVAIGLFGGGWAAFAQVREVARDEARNVTAGIGEEQKALQHSVAELRGDVADAREENRDTKAEVRGLRTDLRAIFPKLPAMDGGAP